MIENYELNIELFEEPEKKFNAHLKIENNERIIFSGKFGHGKTTFLKEFFKLENQKNNFREKKYNIISLFPVNYSIASNEDIFRYIKYDIILEMLKQEYQIEQTIETYYKTLPDFFKKNFTKVFAAIISMIPHVGKDIIESFEKWEKIKDAYFIYHDERGIQNSPSDQFVSYIEKLEQTEGSIYEDDLVSKLIEKILAEKLKEDSAEETILIIDDLDRIDPHHIFRVLNVFAAHFDRKNLEVKNKFGFDKIILVCDIENIRNIFKTKYGASTDFNGYIDKFYSYEIFNYTNRDSLQKYAIKLIMDKAGWNKKQFIHEDTLREKFFGQNRFFSDVLLLLVNNREIDLRNILKWEKLTIPNNDYATFKNGARLYEERFPIILFIRLLSAIKGSPESLKHTLKNINAATLNKQHIREYITDIVYINNILEHNNKKSSQHSYLYNVNDISVILKIDDSGDYKLDAISPSHGLSFDSSHLIWALCESIDFLASQTII